MYDETLKVKLRTDSQFPPCAAVKTHMPTNAKSNTAQEAKRMDCMCFERFEGIKGHKFQETIMKYFSYNRQTPSRCLPQSPLLLNVLLTENKKRIK